MTPMTSSLHRLARWMRPLLMLPLLAFATHGAHAQAYPNKPIRLLVPYAAGGGLDLIARAVGERLSRLLKQPVLVDNRTGANGVVATEAAAKSAADGYTLVLGVPATIVINPGIYKLSFDPMRDLQPVAQLAVAHFLVATAPDSGIESLGQLIALAKASPGKYSFASYGSGSAPHLAGQMLRTLTDIDLVHVPYKGSSAALPDVMTGRVSVIFDVVSNIQPHAAAGKLKVIAAASERVPPQFPKAPLTRSVVPGLSIEGWVGVFAPSATPAAIVNQLNASLKTVLADPELERRLTELGFEVTPTTAQRLQETLRHDHAMYAKAIQAAGLKVE
ncbi:Bug family tripartite tricarboxylate transporter substrate binding protein [Caenimonas aquaedulcis]|uniref:Tripartite tricarboxylate transporter substrate binding protein n=1 Tax=Caenimonas aquaedulcis TaxID=2793270 RepID=A0A931H8T4_9BURK|nr:tripartite tricarboxylate transporter substrate binding protein [Caenimonas aquaedulcis]MBG9390502.1 tripartite tricarboxylate transporter substrate binding protein [Caenimonas aquaedulcis]